jgi:uncharacterized protein
VIGTDGRRLEGRKCAKLEAGLIGKFLLGMISGGVLVTGGLVVGSVFFPTGADDKQMAKVETDPPIAAPEPVAKAEPSEEMVKADPMPVPEPEPAAAAEVAPMPSETAAAEPAEAAPEPEVTDEAVAATEAEPTPEPQPAPVEEAVTTPTPDPEPVAEAAPEMAEEAKPEEAVAETASAPQPAEPVIAEPVIAEPVIAEPGAEPASEPDPAPPMVAEVSQPEPAGDPAKPAPVEEDVTAATPEVSLTSPPSKTGLTTGESAPLTQQPAEAAEPALETALAEAAPETAPAAPVEPTAESALPVVEDAAPASVPEPAAEPAAEMVAETAPEPVMEPAAEAVAEAPPVAEPVPAPVAEPVAEAAEPVTEPTVTPAPEAVPEAVAEAAPTPPPATGEAEVVAVEPPAAETEEPVVELAEATPEPAKPTTPESVPELLPLPEAPVEEPVAEPVPVNPEPEETAEAPVEEPVEAQPEPEVATTEDGSALPGAEAAEMPGTRPEGLPGEADAAPDEPAEEVVADDGAVSTFKPTPGFADRDAAGLTDRLPRIGDDVAAEGDAPADTRPIAAHAAVFENPDAKPAFAVVLVDRGEADLDRVGIAGLPFPVSVALDPLDPATPERAAIYRSGGKEVVMLATGIADGSQPTDIEVAFQSMEQGLPEAVAVMDLPELRFQNNRSLAGAVVPILQAQGRGLLTWDEGLNAADQVARRDDLAAGLIFRDLGAVGADHAPVRRLLDRAVFKAGQDGKVTVVGEASAETVAALVEWTIEGKSATVALAPLTAVLTVE